MTDGLSGVWTDVRHAFRRFRRQPLVPTATTLTFGLAIGLATTIYSVAAGVLMRPFPFKETQRLISIWRTAGTVDFIPLPAPEFLDLQASTKSLETVFGFEKDGFAIRSTAGLRWADAFRVTTNWFDGLGVRPRLGRTFLPQDGQPGHEKVVVLSEAIWRREFGADPAIIGRPLLLAPDQQGTSAAEAYQVIGIVAAKFELAYPKTVRADVYVPKVFTREDLGESARMAPALITFARMREGVDVRAATSEIGGLLARVRREHAAVSIPNAGARVLLLHEELVGRTRGIFLLLAAASAVLLLMAIANVATMLLASGARRMRELSVRLALGCSTAQMVRVLAIEHLVLAAAGAALGVGLAMIATPLMSRLAADVLPRADEIRLDYAAAGFGGTLAIGSGLLFGVLPALILAGRAAAARGGLRAGMVPTQSYTRSRATLIVAETGLVVLLLAGAALIGKAIWHLARMDVGFDATNVLVIQMKAAGGGDTSRAEQRIVDSVRRAQGVASAAMSSGVPFEWGVLSPVKLPGERESHAAVTAVDGGYFDVLRLPLVQGRLPDHSGAKDRDVAVINERLARLFPTPEPVGQRIYAEGRWREVVGVIGNVTELGQLRGGVIRQAGLARLVTPAAYVPRGTVDPDPEWFLLVRTVIPPMRLAHSVETAIHMVAPDIALRRTTTLDEVAGAAGALTRFAGAIVGVFSLTALMLAAVGLYGLLSHTVSLRTRELGIRIALGASSARVRQMVVAGALGWVMLGASGGVAMALWTARAIRALLFEVSPTDPAALASAIAALLVTALLAAYFPARRATRVEPVVALRAE